MRFILLIIYYFAFVGCSQSSLNKKNHDKSDVELVNDVQTKAARALKLEKNLILSGVGSQMMDQIKMIALSFDYFNPVDEVKARELVLSAINELISAVNEEVRIRPFLYNYPFEPKNVEIRIFIQNADGSKFPFDKLSVITALNGILNYKVDDPKNAFFTSVLKETYEEAMQKQAATASSKVLTDSSSSR